MAFKLDATAKPDDNLAAFFHYVKGKDKDLGELLERQLTNIGELGREARTGIVKEAMRILRTRLGGVNG